MFDLFAGLPLHVLVIHAVVVLGPLAAVTALAYILRPAWRRVLRWPTAVLAIVTGVGAWVAAESGAALLQRVSTTRAATSNFDLLAAHQDAGTRAKLCCLAFMVLALAAVWLLRAPGEEVVHSHPLAVLLQVLVGLSAVAALVTIVLAGDAGARAVWDGLAD